MKTELRLMDVTDATAESLVGLSDTLISNEFDSGVANTLVYNEMSDVPVSSRTELETLKENMMVLKDLSDRLSFLSKEVKYLMNLK
ncbi:MAG: hypothetical protein JNM24_07290 [Bdellovibrionaceae bacterium]|nr:hypothetical protein [Pseudobdellovibrionaceae bacterium]